MTLLFESHRREKLAATHRALLVSARSRCAGGRAKMLVAAREQVRDWFVVGLGAAAAGSLSARVVNLTVGDPTGEADSSPVLAGRGTPLVGAVVSVDRDRH
jgi:hypothetical protein